MPCANRTPATAHRHGAGRLRRLAGWAVCASAISPWAASAAISIELRPRVTASQPQVRLGDIAYLRTPDLPSLRWLMALPIATAPRPDASIQLDRDAIAQRVEARFRASGPTTAAIEWSGAETTEVETPAQLLSGEDIVAAARTALTGWLSARGSRAQAQASSSTRDLVLPAGAARLEVRPIAATSGLSKRMQVWLDIWVDERFVRSAVVSFELGDEVPLRTAGPARAPASAAADPVSSKARGGRLAATATAPADSPAAWEPPAVARGDWATLEAGSGSVSVRRRVEIMQDGRPGQTVRVKMPGARGEMLARVAGPGLLEAER